MRTLFLIISAQVHFILTSGQPASAVANISMKSEAILYTAHPIKIVLTNEKEKNEPVTINSIIVRNNIDTLARRYPYAMFPAGQPKSISAGLVDFPGVYFFDIDTVSDYMNKQNRADSLYGRYKMFVHPSAQGQCKCNNSMYPYPVRLQTRLPFPKNKSIIIDSLISRMDEKSVNGKLDDMMELNYPPSKRCDSIRPPSCRVAFVVTSSADDVDTMSDFSIVVDTLGSTAPLILPALIDSCFTIFTRLLLDTSVNALDKTSITANSKVILAAMLAAMKRDNSLFDVYYSNGFVRESIRLIKQADINYLCGMLNLHTRKCNYNQLVLLMKMPIAPRG